MERRRPRTFQRQHILRVLDPPQQQRPLTRFPASAHLTPGMSTNLVVQRLRGISQIEHDARVGLGATAVGKLLAKVDGPVEVQAAVIEDVDVQRLEVGRRVDDADLARLHKVVGDEEVLLVGGDLDVVRANGRLVLVGVVQALDVVQVADVEGGDVVGGRQGEVGEAAILRKIGALRGSVVGFWWREAWDGQGAY